MTRNITALYNTITNDPNAMAHVCLASNTEQRAALLVRLGQAYGLPVSYCEAQRFLAATPKAA